MASVLITPPGTTATIINRLCQRSSSMFLKQLPVRPPPNKTELLQPKSRLRLGVKSSLKEKAVTGLTAAALTAYMAIPEVAEAAGSGITPSLKNFLLSIVAGGVVVGVIAGAVVAVANFDPVKRR